MITKFTLFNGFNVFFFSFMFNTKEKFQHYKKKYLRQPLPMYLINQQKIDKKIQSIREQKRTLLDSLLI